MKVLSLFDGISCGYLALQRAGIPIDAYYASEIDNTCIKVSQKHFPNIIRLGDVLQTLPDDYLDGIAPNTVMSLAGNGWTVDVIAHLLRSIERKQMNDIVKEFRKITDELMFGSSETGTNVTCDKHEQNEAIRRVKTVKGSSWKKDIHPPKGHKNWWEDICDPISRSIMELNFKKEINNQIWYEQKQGND